MPESASILTPQTLRSAFVRLGELAHARGLVIDIAVYGGSALMLASNFRVATADVDAVVFPDQQPITELADIVAIERNWPRDWLNDGVRTYLSPEVDGLAEHHELFDAYPSQQQPGVRVFVPSPAYLLAMKLMAMRTDPAAGSHDLDDILNLIQVLGITSKDELLAFARSFYPSTRENVRARLHIEALWSHVRTSSAPKEPHEPPHYLGRRRNDPA